MKYSQNPGLRKVHYMQAGPLRTTSLPQRLQVRPYTDSFVTWSKAEVATSEDQEVSWSHSVYIRLAYFPYSPIITT